MKTLSILCALAIPASAQVFDWSIPTRLNENPAELSGQITVDSSAGTASVDGILSAASGSFPEEITRTTITQSGTFPFVETFTKTTTAEISISFPDLSIAFDVPAATPTFVRGSIFSMPYTGQDITFDVDFTYTLAENGVQFDAGSGSYLVSGRPTRIYIDVAAYPTAVAVGMDGFPLPPTVPGLMFDSTSPTGVRMSSGTLPLFVGFTVVPEPSTYAALAGVALLGFAAWRSTGCKQSSRYTKKV